MPLQADELLIARNPDAGSTLPYLLRVPVGEGIVLRTAGTWPRTKALFCYPVPATEWPEVPEIVERVPLRSCVRRGAAIDLVADRARESRSQLVFTTARGREATFWQSPRTRRQARPQVRAPTARAAGVEQLEIVVDSRERYPFRFPSQRVRVLERALPCGDYAVVVEGRIVAAVERKSLADLIGSLTRGTLRYALAELASLPRAAVVVEDRYSQVFKSDRVRPAVILDGLAECQVRWPEIATVFCETRSLAEEWTYRYLAAAYAWARREPDAGARIANLPPVTLGGPAAPGPTASEVRAWARANDIPVPERGRLPAAVEAAWSAAHPA